MLEFSGTVGEQFEPEYYGNKRGKRIRVIVSRDRQDIEFTFYGDNCDELDGVQSGDEIKVSFVLQGQKNYGTYYNTVVGLTVEQQEK
jgi:hypothetical protein